MKKILLATAIAAGVVLAPGVANAVPGEPGQCTGTGYCKVEPVSNGTLDGWSVVVKDPSFSDKVWSTLGHALADIIFGPRWK